MLILRNFSKLQDEDYIEGQNERKKGVKHAKGTGAFLGGGLGGMVGGQLGHAVTGGSGKGALVGAGVGLAGGALAGYKIGGAHKKSVEKDADKKIARYGEASEKDRKYLREKEEREKDRRLKERQAIAQEQMAWNSYRW